jgi:hypothetical protein
MRGRSDHEHAQRGDDRGGRSETVHTRTVGRVARKDVL